MILFSESLDIFDKINFNSGDEKYLNRVNQKTVMGPKMSSDRDSTQNFASSSQI
jgi:hypothetical protein